MRNKTPIESYVEMYLKQINKIQYRNVDLLLKARTYIQEKLNTLAYPNCNAIVDLHTLKDNTFTRTIFYMIENMGISQNRKSLERTILLIDRFIASCCTLN